ncbi:MAG TPA: IMP dehydrogenase [Gammaproteobacteria bacterium]|nr:IMP dehydrogenase [Gammaproteobacteria bacterium]
MTIRVAIQHNTYYQFDRPVSLSPHIIRLRPAAHTRTPIHAYSMKVTPESHFLNWQQDPFGNFLAKLDFQEKTRELAVEVEVIADMTVINPFDFFVEDYAENYPFEYPQQLHKELSPYLERIETGPAFRRYLNDTSTERRRGIDFLVALIQRLNQDIAYNIRMDPGVQTPDETLSKGRGSCRDSAWLLVQLLRHLGWAARFASGYLVQLKPDEKPIDGPGGAAEDFTDLHAWCEVYLPGAGWVGLDPTSGLFAGEGHIPLAGTPDPISAAPIQGATEPCEVEFQYSNTVTRVHEDPRVTKPYTEDAWAGILTLGDQVDKDLADNDVRLTMGGEPTFVSIDDMESAQWNTRALGDDKLRLSKTLLLRLRDHFAPHGLLHYGQGKWYPGEEVPRWALGVFWRQDDEPLWRDPALLARVDKHYGHTLKTAASFAYTLSHMLGLPNEYLHPAYEDALYYLLEEQKLPADVEARVASAKDDKDRRRLARLLQQGFEDPVGYVLPLERHPTEAHWVSSRWKLRRARLVLTPGDSPMGLRLPLGELASDDEPDRERDPFAPRDALQRREDIQFPSVPPGNVVPMSEAAAERQRKRRAADDAAAPELVRTALCVEVRDGKVHLFMPPLYALEDYVELIAAIEETARALKTPVVIEGYEPPKDARLNKLLVTPDPGVIEVNIHPSHSWRELVANMTELYSAARESRLATEKFMLDGRHTGTGGGNHLTLGGPTPADSPLLRRPDLLRSLVTYWQHHPSLSYIFSGAFVGPTSQAPRMDEGRDEMLYEMEIAFQQMPEGITDQPWLIDRLMRNLLIDITGNTHRAEFCIDKLFSPGSASGRQGILEFRGFEMPPHSRMALVQALLIRTLIGRFWKAPYHKPLVRWGTSLHDKFMLPHFLWQDMREVVADLQAHGYDFRAEWLLPFEEFRFPHYGRVTLDDIEIELRWAVEPWHVLGEEVGAFGTSRYVDSSVERLQVKVSGLTDNRYVLACNGRRVPLSPTGRQGEYVAGVRYRAWAPPSALHPTLGVNAPLHFDLIDTWNGRAIGGCSYHVSHPGGLAYETLPVNAWEAESRRVNRYGTLSHTPGPYTPQPNVDALREFFPESTPRPMQPPPEESPGEYPHTLDLRRQRNTV